MKNTPTELSNLRDLFDKIIQKYLYAHVVIINCYDVRIDNLAIMAKFFDVNPFLLKKTIVSACVRMSNIFSTYSLKTEKEIMVIRKVIEKEKMIHQITTKNNYANQHLAFY